MDAWTPDILASSLAGQLLMVRELVEVKLQISWATIESRVFRRATWALRQAEGALGHDWDSVPLDWLLSSPVVGLDGGLLPPERFPQPRRRSSLDLSGQDVMIGLQPPTTSWGVSVLDSSRRVLVEMFGLVVFRPGAFFFGARHASSATGEATALIVFLEWLVVDTTGLADILLASAQGHLILVYDNLIGHHAADGSWHFQVEGG
jgi:hypothetical protein